MKQNYVNPDGSETYFVELGVTGNTNQCPHGTLLLLHGLGADHNMWQPQMQTYAREGFHLLIPDLFGHGRSSKLKTLNLSDWHNQINWLLDYKAVEQFTLIGVSMGGVIAQSFTVEYPHRVKKIIIADSFGELRTFREKLLGFSQVLGFSVFKALNNKLLASTMRSTYEANYAKAAQQYFEKISLTVDLDQIILARKAINQIDALDKLNRVTVPAIVIVGADFGQSFIAINRKIADALPNAKFVILEHSIDPSNLVNPADFNLHVLRFLKRT